MAQSHAKRITVRSQHRVGGLRAVLFLQVSLLDIKNSLPGIEAFNNERIQVLLKTQASKYGTELGHSSALTGEPRGAPENLLLS
jgi:hypothetical protein